MVSLKRLVSLRSKDASIWPMCSKITLGKLELRTGGRAMARILGQYSIVTYTHELRGERINLGVLVWHPRSGCVFRSTKNLSRIRSIDESADLDRVRASLEQISQVADTWREKNQSPLQDLAREFRHRLVVTHPRSARIQDPLSTLERISATLIPPEPFYVSASSTAQFANAFAKRLGEELKRRGVS